MSLTRRHSLFPTCSWYGFGWYGLTWADIQCESEKSSPPKTFCDIFTCGEPM